MTTAKVPLGDLVTAARVVRAGNDELQVYSMTSAGGLVLQDDYFKKSIASRDTSKYKVVRPGQVVVGIHVDEGAIGVSREHHNGIVSPAYTLWDIEAAGRIDHCYLDRFIRSPSAKQYFIANYRQTAQRRGKLTRERFLELLVPLPPIEEQRRVAAILDAADALRAKRRQALAKLDTLTQAIFIEMFRDPPTDQLRALGDVLRVSSGEGLTKAQMVEHGKYPVYGGNGVSGYHDEFMFEERQVVIGRVGVYCGAIHYTPEKSWVTDNALIVKDLDPSVLPGYLVECLRFADLNRQADQAAQPLISGKRIYPVQICVPPPEQQVDFINRIADVNAVIKASKKGASSFDALFASLQQRAFRGEL